MGIWLIGAISQYFAKNKKIQSYEVSDLLEDIMSEEFNAELDDGSEKEIGSILCKCYDLYSTNRKAELLQMIGHAPIAEVSKCESMGGAEGEDEDDECMDLNDAITATFNSCSISTTPIHKSTIEEIDEPTNELKTFDNATTSKSIGMDCEDNDEWTPVSHRTRNKTRSKNI